MTDLSMPRESASQSLSYTPLRERHEALGASFTDFGGWAMPVRYTSDLAEHHAVRTAAGLFDISHMAQFGVAGPTARRSSPTPSSSIRPRSPCPRRSTR